MDLAFFGANIVTPFRVVKKGVITTKKERIYHVGPENQFDYSKTEKIIDVSDKYIVPGFIDLLVHGGK